jgi:superoxide reductase
MSQMMELYKCPSTGDVVEVTHAGESAEGTICTGEESACPWRRLPEKIEEKGLQEKHVPVIERSGEGIKVKIGSIPHPMLPEHHIEWVEVRQGLYCNIHELWTNKK